MDCKVAYSALQQTDTAADRQRDSSVSIDYHSPFTFDSPFQYGTPDILNVYRYQRNIYSDGKPDLQTHPESTSMAARVCDVVITTLSVIIGIITCPISAPFMIKVVPVHERWILYRLGKLKRVLQSGPVFIVPCIDSISKVDIRVRAFNVPPTQIVLEDGSLAMIGASVYHHAENPLRLVTNVQNVNHALRVAGQTTLAKLMLRCNTRGLETNTNQINADLVESLNEVTTEWGVRVSKCEISISGGVVMPPLDSNNPLALLAKGQTNLPPKMQDLGGLFSTIQSAFSGATAHIIGQQSAPANEELNPVVQSQEGDLVNSVVDATVAKATNILNENASSMGSVNAVVLFRVVDKETSGVCREFTLDLVRVPPIVYQGAPGSNQLDVTVTMPATTLLDLASKRESMVDAYWAGRIQVDGDPMTSLRLMNTLGSFSDSLFE